MFAKKSISRIFSVLFVIIFVLTVTPLQAAHAAGVARYAKPAASGTGNCLSWDNACTLQTALTVATSGDEIWVAAGTYKPTTDPANRDATFQLNSGVALYGGFAGKEKTRDQRNPATNVTILSGDIDNNDSQKPIITDLTTVTGNTTNSYHVVTGTVEATGANLDGFTVTAGNANSADADIYCDGNGCGGGMFNDGSSPTLTDVTFHGNTAINGGGMYNGTEACTALTDVTFSGNTATYNGGGMDNEDCSPTLMNVIFSGNTAEDGGGMYTYQSPTLINVTFSGNTARNGSGGGMHGENSTLTNVTFSGNIAAYNGGGMSNDGDSTLTDVTFSHNFADAGGGMSNNLSSPTLTNVTFSWNAAQVGGGMENFDNSSPQIRNTIFWQNTAMAMDHPETAQIGNSSSTPNVSYSVIQGGCPAGSSNCTHIIIADPLLGTLGNYGGFTQTIPLLVGSSAIDTGNDAICPPTDQRGVSRPQGAYCDIGAYEVEYIDTTAPTVNTFTLTTPSSSLNIPITAFSATDDVAVTGYLITTSSTPPAAGAAGWTGTAPATYTVASDGSYTLYPWAKDAAGNVSTVFASPPAVVVDTTAPDTQIDTHPANPSNSADASFTFSSADGTATFECSLDGGAYAGCASSKNYTGLAAGSHTFAVRAKDPVGNVDATPASYTWMIDLTAPTVVSSVRANANPTSATSVHFTVTFSEAVTGVDTADFSLTTTGTLSSASLTDVSGSGTTYTVTVSTGKGGGTLRLDIPVSATITDEAGNPLSGLPYTGGETYTIMTRVFLPMVSKSTP